VHYGLRVLGRRAKTGDPGYGRNWDNSNREFLFVSDNRELVSASERRMFFCFRPHPPDAAQVWQNNVGSWWHMKNMTGGGDKAVTVFVEVTDPDWGGVSKTDQGSAGIKMSLGPNVLLYDPGSKKGRCQIRLSKKYAEEVMRAAIILAPVLLLTLARAEVHHALHEGGRQKQHEERAQGVGEVE
jgi:hypothetical protein